MNEKYEDDYYLAEILIEDFTNRITSLRIPIKCLESSVQKLLTECLESFKKHGIVDLRDLSKTSQQGYINLFTSHDIFTSDWESMLAHYESNILERYKSEYIKKISADLQQGNIQYKDFVKKINDVNNYELSTTSNFKTVSELNTNEIEKEYIKSEICTIDREIKGFALGELSIWSGGNASAKSTFLNQIALESINQNYNVAIYSGELPSQKLLSWLILQACGKKNIENKNGFYFPNENAKDKILYWLDKKIFIYENSVGNKAKNILSSIKNCISKNNVKTVIIDNLMSLDMNGYSDNKYDAQSELVKDLSVLAKRYNVHIHFVCHPRKSITFLRKVDISGTADITNIADNVFIMHRVNNDFVKATKEMFGLTSDNQLYRYTNVIEICKNREFGVQDCFVGLFFEKESRRLLNSESEIKRYGWEMMK